MSLADGNKKYLVHFFKHTNRKNHINNTNQSSDSSVNRQVPLIKTAQARDIRGGSDAGRFFVRSGYSRVPRQLLPKWQQQEVGSRGAVVP